MEFTIHPVGPLNFDLSLQRFRLYGEDAAHAYADGVYYRAVEIAGRVWGCAVRGGGSVAEPVLQVGLLGGRAQARQRAVVEADLRRSLSLDVDLDPFYRWAEGDPILAALKARCYGLRPFCVPTLFEALITAISAQQVNLTFATTTRSRLIRRYGQLLTHAGKSLFTFPTPEALADAPLQELRKMQFSWRKAEYIVNLARLVATGALKLHTFPQLTNAEVIERITQVKGLGRWTADWLLARGLGRGDVIAAGDLGVRKAIGRFYFGGELPSTEEVRAFAARWGMFQHYAVQYLLAGFRFEEGIRAPRQEKGIT